MRWGRTSGEDENVQSLAPFVAHIACSRSCYYERSYLVYVFARACTAASGSNRARRVRIRSMISTGYSIEVELQKRWIFGNRKMHPHFR